MFSKYKFHIIALFALAAVLCGLALPFVNINYDMTKYLPDDSKTKRSVDILGREFGRTGYLQLMADGVSSDGVRPLQKKLSIEGIKNIDYTVNGKSVLFKIALDKDDYSREAQDTLRRLRGIMDETGLAYYMNGQAYMTYINNEMMARQIPKIVLCLVPLILLILFMTTSSWLDPFLLAFVVGISVLFNMGTNALLPYVSEMINSIGAVLQFAVCMDYSIILLNRFRDCRSEGLAPDEAMARAWRSSIVPIAAASLTTVAGFIAIMFMRYKIGFDVGLVLAKGVALTLVTVIFLMPCLILLADRLLAGTAHSPILTAGSGYGKFIFRTRYILPIPTLVIIAAAGFVQSKNSFNYGDNSFNLESGPAAYENEKIRERFGFNSPAVILIDKDINSEELCGALAEAAIDGKRYVTSVRAFDRQMNLTETVDFLKNSGVSEGDMKALFGVINRNQPDKNTVSLSDIYSYIAALKRFDEQMTAEEMTAFLRSLAYVKYDEIESIYGYAKRGRMSLIDIISFMQAERSQNDMAEIFQGELSPENIGMAYSASGEDTMSLSSFIGFFYRLLTEERDAESMAELLQGQASLEETKSLFAMAGEEKMSLADMADFFNRPLSQSEMKKAVPDIPDIGLTYLYKLHSENSGEDKAALKQFIALVKDEFSGYLSKSRKKRLRSFEERIASFDAYRHSIDMLKAAAPAAAMLTSMDLKKIRSYQNVDAGLIKREFVGSEYQRIILEVDLPEESPLSFEFYSLLEEKIKSAVGDKFYITAATPSVMDVKEASSEDYAVATIVSVILIFLIIAALFKSVSVPALLIVLIEGAIFINMSVPALTGRNLFFVGYLIVSCIQLGATIDYGILMSSRYITNRKSFDKRTAMGLAAQESAASIITSGSILTVSGLSLGLISDVAIIAILGRLIGFGGLISSVLVLCALPQFLYICDRLLIRKGR